MNFRRQAQPRPPFSAAQHRYSLHRDQVGFFQRHGYLHLRGYYDVPRRRELQSWVDAMQQWPETPFAFMQYFEDVAGRRTLCRMEYLLEYHEGLRAFVLDDPLRIPLSQLLGEPALLYKEKINFKLPGGQGFAAHQDAPAFLTGGQRYHITAMISVDPSNENNGCLEIASEDHAHVLRPQAADGTLAADHARCLRFRPLPTAAGDVIFFDSYVPHRSGPNRSTAARRALYITYNGRSAGDRRLQYFLDKRERFPPECERVPGRDYAAGAALYNLANPIRG